MLRTAYNEQGVAALQRAYDEVMHDLFGELVPEECFRESIAAAILYAANAGEEDWKLLALYARTKVKDLLRDRDVLLVRKPPPRAA